MKDKPLYEVTQIRDLRELIKKRVKDHPENPCFLVKEQKGGEYVPIMPDKYDKDIDGLGTALMTLVNKGAKVAILGETRYEWFVSYLAVTNGTGCVVPLDKELPAEEIESMLERADVEILIFSKAKLEAVEAVYGKVPSVKHYICMDKLDDTKYSYFWDVVKKGTDLIASGDKTFIDTTIDPDEMTILLFTSGTTAKSKAVMLCQKNICKNLMSMYSFVYIDPKDVFMSVLPLHHTYECTCGFLGQVYRGSTLAVCEGLRYITTNIKECNPTCILMVPAMAEMFYKAIWKKLNSDPKLLKKFNTGRKLSNGLRKIGIDLRRKLFKDIHETFGGRLRLLIVGGAPINPVRSRSSIRTKTVSVSSQEGERTYSSVITRMMRRPRLPWTAMASIIQVTSDISITTDSASLPVVRRTLSLQRTVRMYSLKRSNISWLKTL